MLNKDGGALRKFWRGLFRVLFVDPPRPRCRHCGGVRCIGACQFDSGREAGKNKP
jgi:hypothetical protein